MAAAAKSTPKIIKGSVIQHHLQHQPSKLEVQAARCYNSQYRSFERCKACVAKKTEGCRFMSLRAFTRNVKKELVYGPHFISYEGSDEIQNLKPRRHGTLRGSGRRHVLKTIRKALIKILDEDKQIAEPLAKKIRRRAPVKDVRHVCDVCLTSIFNLHFMCGVCGLDLCVTCHKNWDKLPAAGRCTARRVHTQEHLVPIVKYSQETMNNIHAECMMDIDGISPSTESQSNVEPLTDENKNPVLEQSTVASVPEADTITATETNTNGTDAEPPQITTNKESVGGVLYIAKDDITLDIFQNHWKQGQPVVVRNVMDTSEMSWSPSFFMNNYGPEVTDIIDCVTGHVQESTVEAFFRGFVDPTQRPGYNESKPDRRIVLKIKDWPPKADFKNQFPELFTDFMKILPVPEYCSYNGYFNLSNRLPQELVPPDLGPKMFIAYGATDGQQSVGTTKLHCDMADAVNVMCYADKTDDQPAAVWDMYAYEDLPVLRKFVQEIANERRIKVIDPIHSQWLYLNDELQERLFTTYGIRSWRIYQNPGDAVFVPAGCAHQVSNYHSAVKCAYDFVSPENVGRCIDITSQFGRVRREDALQLKNTLLFAWTDIYTEQ